MRSIFPARPVVAAMLLATLSACAVGSAHDGRRPDAVADGSDFTMRPGQQVALGGDGRLRYLRVLDDSRCQPDVQCVWAGDAEIAFEWTPAAGPIRPFSLHTGKPPREQALSGRRLTLVSLARGPVPEAVLRIDRAPSP